MVRNRVCVLFAIGFLVKNIIVPCHGPLPKTTFLQSQVSGYRPHDSRRDRKLQLVGNICMSGVGSTRCVLRHENRLFRAQTQLLTPLRPSPTGKWPFHTLLTLLQIQIFDDKATH